MTRPEDRSQARELLGFLLNELDLAREERLRPAGGQRAGLPRGLRLLGPVSALEELKRTVQAIAEAHEKALTRARANSAAMKVVEMRERCAKLVESCKPDLVDGTTHLVRQQLDAIAELIRDLSEETDP